MNVYIVISTLLFSDVSVSVCIESVWATSEGANKEMVRLQQRAKALDDDINYYVIQKELHQ